MRILISTGEVSGDVIGALLTRAIRAERPDASILAIGDARMADAGADVRFKSSHLGTVGVTEAFARLPDFARALATVRTIIKRERPDAAVLIGNDLFHVLLGRWLKSRGVATVSYFPPQIWVWRSLARPIARSFDAVLTSFHDEQAVYQRAGGATTVTFVGHYLSDLLARRTPDTIASARRRLGLEPGGPIVGLMPGSRGHEIRTLVPVLVGAAARLLTDDPTLRFVVPVVDDRYRARIARDIARADIADRVTVVTGPSRDAMIAADLLVLASGTASLEATLLGIPMVIVYRVSTLTYGVIRACIRLGLIESDTVGLPNLILGRRAVPELIQYHVNATEVAAAAAAVLGSPDRERAIVGALVEAAGRLSGGDAIGRAARCVVELADETVSAAAGAGARAALDAPVAEPE